ncbi:hypothetical protein L7F22_048449 [Adiantum nelumboides]|nr:hypothetical protein [Adiantum nelumboides]
MQASLNHGLISRRDGEYEAAPVSAVMTTEDAGFSPRVEAWKTRPSALPDEALNLRKSRRMTSACMYAEASATADNAEGFESDQVIFHDRDSYLYFGRDNHDLSKDELLRLRDMFKTEISCLQLLQEITGNKMWEAPDGRNVRGVPPIFDSVEHYVGVFEPLLVEECRAQLRHSWEKLTAGGAPFVNYLSFSMDGLYVDKRGWVALVLMLQCGQSMESFNDGDIAVMQIEEIAPGRKRKHSGSYLPVPEEITVESTPKGIAVWGVGTYFNFIEKLPHKDCDLLQIRNAVLKPSLEGHLQRPNNVLPKPLCWADPFLQSFHEIFNEPQSNVIISAAHSVGGTPIEESHENIFPFTIVQGPPGTGKTHTLLGILNVIHLILDHRYRSTFMQALVANLRNLNEGAGSSSACDSRLVYQLIEGKARSLSQKPRILVCAPSNAATDELLTRVIEQGFFDRDMKSYKPRCIRVGLLAHCNAAAHAMCIKSKAQQVLRLRLGDIERRLKQHGAMLNLLDLRLKKLLGELRVESFFGKGVNMDSIFSQNQIAYLKFKKLTTIAVERMEVRSEIKRLSIVHARYCGGKFSIKKARGKLEKSFARDAEIVFTTLSSSRSPTIRLVSGRFDVLIVDEAAQASEVATLPPLTLGAPHCILLGDPKQLAATVISTVAQSLGYSRSLFERLQLAGCPVLMLREQYRMHPQIREFPSIHFYQGLLQDNARVLSFPDEIYHMNPLLRPYLFFDLAYGKESKLCDSGSFQNLMEAKFAAQLYEHLLEVMNKGSLNISVGVVTPYKLQLECLKQEFGPLKSAGKDVYFNTVDAFQGQERDVMIMSCVRAGNYGVGFVADVRRMNVALTRAHRSLWVIGNARTLCTSKDWEALIANAKQRGCFITVSTPEHFDNLKRMTSWLRSLSIAQRHSTVARNIEGIHGHNI